MRFDSSQRKAFADWILKFALYWLTSLPVSLMLGNNDIPWYVAFAVGVIGIFLLFLGIILSKKDPEEQIHTEIKKGIFHVGNAEIKH